MRKEDKGKRRDFYFGFYPRDERRLNAVRELVEEITGRPASCTRAVVYLLDCHDESLKLDAVVKQEAERLNGLKKGKNGLKKGKNGGHHKENS